MLLLVFVRRIVLFVGVHFVSVVLGDDTYSAVVPIRAWSRVVRLFNLELLLLLCETKHGRC